DNSHGGLREQRRLCRAAEEQARWRIVKLSEERREALLGASDESKLAGRQPGQVAPDVEAPFEALVPLLPWPLDHVATGLGREHGEGEIAHLGPSSEGDLNESASATCSGPISGAPASSAAVRATRATLARPRADRGRRSTARESRSLASRER